jgi:hypothetical protein
VSSERQILANRRNAQKSTGPKTEAGKKKARMNALRHGLSAQTMELAPEFLQQFPEGRHSLNGGLRAAATLGLVQLHRYRSALLVKLNASLCAGQSPEASLTSGQLIKKLLALDRYERRLHWCLRRLERSENDKTKPILYGDTGGD